MKYFFSLFIILCCLQTKAQILSEVLNEFDSIVLSSNRYKEYRVIKKVKLESFKKVLKTKADSLEESILSLKKGIKTTDDKVQNLQERNKVLSDEVNKINEEKDNINFFEIELTKSTYNLIVWSIIGLLLFTLIFLFLKYRNDNIIAQEIKENLKNTNSEFEEYKHRSIEKQQKLGRELLDAQKKAQQNNTNT